MQFLNKKNNFKKSDVLQNESQMSSRNKESIHGAFQGTLTNYVMQLRWASVEQKHKYWKLC